MRGTTWSWKQILFGPWPWSLALLGGVVVFVLVFLGVHVQRRDDGGRREVHEVVGVIESNAAETALNETSHPRQ